jgi:hypothetical protein
MTLVKSHLDLTAEERYDDDALFRVAGGPGGADLMTKLIPKFGLQLKNPTLTLDGWYAADFMFMQLSRTFRLDHRMGLKLTQRLSRTTAVDADLGVWRVQDPTSLPRLSVALTMNPVLYARLTAGVTTQLSRRWTARFQYAFEGTQVYQAGDPVGTTNTPSGEMLYRATRQTSVGFGYRYQYFAFGTQKNQGHTPEGLFRYRFDPFTTLNLRAGPVFFGTDVQQMKTAPMLDLNLYRHVRHVELGLVAGQDVVGASGFTSALWTQYVGGQVGWRATRPLRVWGGGNVFRNGAAPGGVDAWLGRNPQGIATGYGLGVGGEYDLNPYLSMQCQLDRIVQTGVYGAGGNISRNIGAVRFVLKAW